MENNKIVAKNSTVVNKSELFAGIFSNFSQYFQKIWRRPLSYAISYCLDNSEFWEENTQVMVNNSF